MPKVIDEYGNLVDLSSLSWADKYALPEHPKAWCKYFPAHEGQMDVLTSDARFVLALGGKNSGKSSCGAVWLLQRLLEKPKEKYLVLGPTFQTVTTATKDVWLKTVKDTPFDGGPKAFHAGNSPYYECATGAVIYFRSAVDPDSFEGIKPHGGCWIDEAGQVSHEAWKAVKGRLVGVGARCVLTTTPYPKFTWLVTDFIKLADEGVKDKEGKQVYFYRVMPTTLNPSQDIAALEEERRTLSPWEYQFKYEGKFTKPAGLVYPDFDACLRDLKDLPTPLHAYYGAVDWGGADPTVCLVGGLDDHNNLWVLYEFHTRNLKQDIVEIIQDIKVFDDELKANEGKGVSKYWCDRQPQNIRPLKRCGLNARPIPKGQGSIKAGISLLRARINNTIRGRPQGLYILRSECPEAIKESNLYRYKTDDDGDLCGEVPLAGHDHCMDALRYLVTGLDRKSRPNEYINP